jgi:hypothetical protein
MDVLGLFDECGPSPILQAGGIWGHSIDGIVCGACMDVHTPILSVTKSPVFMLSGALGYAWEPRQMRGWGIWHNGHNGTEVKRNTGTAAEFVESAG